MLENINYYLNFPFLYPLFSSYFDPGVFLYACCRYLYEYAFWAVSVGLCFSIALRFANKNPIAVLVGQGIVLCMLCQHPTYSDIMVWLGFLPIVLMEQNQWQENKENEKDGEDSGGGGSLLKPAVKVWFAIGFCISLGLNTAAYEVRLGNFILITVEKNKKSSKRRRCIFLCQNLKPLIAGTVLLTTCSYSSLNFFICSYGLL